MSRYKLRPANLRAFFLLFFLFSLALSYFYWPKTPKIFSNLWQQLGIVGLTDYPSQQFTEIDWQAETQTWHFEIHPKNEIIRGLVRKNIEQSVAEEILQKRKNSLFLLYSDSRDPYFSAGQQQLSCGEKWRLSWDQKSSINAIANAYATDRLAYRACDEKTAAYRVETLFTYCANLKVWVELEYFVPREALKNNPVKTLQSFSCDSID